MSVELVTALNRDTCKGTLSFDRQSYNWPCGLSISVQSTAKLTAESYVLAAPDLWKAAHQKHHASGHVVPRGQRASIYFESKGELPTVTSVYCSCEVKADA